MFNFAGMELLVKWCANGLVRVGIKYPTPYQAVKSYETLIQVHRHDVFMLDIEPLKVTAHLHLRSVYGSTQVAYKHLVSRPDQLRKLQAFAGASPAFQFVHVYSQANVLLVARPFKRSEFITVKGCEFTSSPY